MQGRISFVVGSVLVGARLEQQLCRISITADCSIKQGRPPRRARGGVEVGAALQRQPDDLGAAHTTEHRGGLGVLIMIGQVKRGLAIPVSRGRVRPGLEQ